jgi:hypothetical protein
MMKKIIALAAFCAALQAAPVLAQVQVVANPSVGASKISASDLKDVFLGGKSTLSDGSAVEPVLAEDGATHKAFLQKYVGKSDHALRTYLKSLVFTGKGSMPKSFRSDAEIVRYVAATKGAIGYVSPTTDTAGLKKLQVQ